MSYRERWKLTHQHMLFPNGEMWIWLEYASTICTPRGLAWKSENDSNFQSLNHQSPRAIWSRLVVFGRGSWPLKHGLHLGLSPPPRMPVANEGSGWDSLEILQPILNKHPGRPTYQPYSTQVMRSFVVSWCKAFQKVTKKKCTSLAQEVGSHWKDESHVALAALSVVWNWDFAHWWFLFSTFEGWVGWDSKVGGGSTIPSWVCWIFGRHEDFWPTF